MTYQGIEICVDPLCSLVGVPKSMGLVVNCIPGQ